MRIQQINLDGVDLKSTNHNFNIEGLFEFEKDIVSNDLYLDGESFYRSKTKAKKLILNGYIKDYDMNKYMLVHNLFISNKLKKLTITEKTLGELYCYVETSNLLKGSLGTRTLSCQLTMPDPHLYMLNPVSIQLGSTYSNALTFPFTFPITFGAATGGQGVITNTGNCISYPVITVVGTCSNLIITNETTGESITINVSLGATDTLIIDNRPKSRGIYLNGVNRMDLKTGLWLSCNVGDNNFTFQRSSLENKKHCTIELQSAFV